MTESKNSNTDELDTGWEAEAPISAPSVQSLPPTAVLAAIDEGWDAKSEPVNPPAASNQAAVSAVELGASRANAITESLDSGWDDVSEGAFDMSSSRRGGKLGNLTQKPHLSKKERRLLERQARAHQVERDLENRQQRRAMRQQSAEQRAIELQAQRDQIREQERKREQERVQLRSKKRAKPKQPKPEAKLAIPADPPQPPSASIQGQATAPNRAARRSKSAKVSPSSATVHEAAAPPSKKYAIGPFPLFIGVVLVASLLSYFFIR